MQLNLLSITLIFLTLHCQNLLNNNDKFILALVNYYSNHENLDVSE